MARVTEKSYSAKDILRISDLITKAKNEIEQYRGIYDDKDWYYVHGYYAGVQGKLIDHHSGSADPNFNTIWHMGYADGLGDRENV